MPLGKHRSSMSGKSVKIQKEQKDSASGKTKGAHSSTSLSSNRASRNSFVVTYLNEVTKAIEFRRFLNVVQEFDGVTYDVTPKYIDLDMPSERLDVITFKIQEMRDLRDRFSDAKSVGTSSAVSIRHSIGRVGLAGLRLSMEDIVQGIGSGLLKFDSAESLTVDMDEEYALLEELAKQTAKKYSKPFIRVTLSLSENILLYGQRSLTASKDTRDGEYVIEDNQVYDYLTVGKGKIRRRSDAEVQTNMLLYKTRDINTVPQPTVDKGSYVSYFEMFDTLAVVMMPALSVYLPDQQQGKMEVPKTNNEMVAEIMKLPMFNLATMVVERMLAGNVFRESQRRFRNMDPIDCKAMDVEFLYTLRLLFAYPEHVTDNERKAVTDLSFNRKNGDILAVGYGIYTFMAMHVPKTGTVCVWHIKNPKNAERIYYYRVPVASVEFSPFVPTLLAVGLYDGSVEVRDITYPNTPAIAVSQRSISQGVDPVLAIRWIKQTEGADSSEIDPFLTLSQDGSVTKFRIISSPYLLGFKQMVLQRVEGNPEGLLVNKGDILDLQANRHPQGLNLTIHPLYKDIFYVLTDEGCVHKCSINYTHSYLEVWKTHAASVNSMDFSPWSPKMYLTCGNDWCIRIWIDGISKPLVTLKSQMTPVYAACWSHMNSTIIFSINRKTFDIWDIRRNILKPVSSIALGSSYHTTFQIARCGNCVAIGNERGSVLIAAFDDFPFPPHFQYDELEKAIYKAIANYPDLIIEVKSVGFFGYPRKGFVSPL